ncbi:hypothetical protein D3C86_1816600 [compost metagenome]
MQKLKIRLRARFGFFSVKAGCCISLRTAATSVFGAAACMANHLSTTSASLEKSS